MKRLVFSFGLILVAIGTFGSCDIAGKTTVNFAITDAPADSASITSVMARISSVAINESADGNISETDGSWKILDISPAAYVDLLTLQNGVVESLGDIDINGGTQINQIRLGVDSVVVTDGGVEHPASIPSKTGLKIVSAFSVPLSGLITITIDFNVRKSLVLTGGSNPKYIVKPAIRAILENEAGKITGTSPVDSVVYAYAGSSWDEVAETTANADGLLFTGAYASASTKSDGTFVLAFLDAGTYTLVSVNKDDSAVLKTLSGIVVNEGESTTGIVMIP